MERQSCGIVGCVAHVSRQVRVDVQDYKFCVHFLSEADLLLHAGESVGRKVQEHVRGPKNKKAPFPTGREVNITSRVEFTRTREDILNDLETMDPETMKAQLASATETQKIISDFMAKKAAEAAKPKK
jgi:hypothetical protein